MDVPVVPESSHPEWDLMYRAGLPFGRIAALCHAPASTVHRHLQHRIVIDPGLNEDYQANKTTDSRPLPGKAWLQRVEELRKHIAVAGRAPVHSGATREEQNLASWLSQQRARERHGRLHPSHLEVLDAVGEWRSTPREIADAQRWFTRLGQLKEFVATERPWPRYKGFSSEDERVLGVWLHGQRQKNHRNQLTDDQIRFLNSTVPGWSQPHRVKPEKR
ncbi:helicase associated domain-containing protein [Paenarthrobacter sp. PH39-S1]|uniref:helicase associated domain-containing protein n=1 Tax=Paenarthrobacter sp. PH39-S1 TaxID=3046204 RepID=UPI0024B88490|nr:helicase associated domain-containing protein [Paenarthrobacter sp. PH39-S1]MDJ0356644.1 helicase associated domain-containing protein [Paenarthrobacter sp. PH39-S1]